MCACTRNTISKERRSHVHTLTELFRSGLAELVATSSSSGGHRRLQLSPYNYSEYILASTCIWGGTCTCTCMLKWEYSMVLRNGSVTERSSHRLLPIIMEFSAVAIS